MAVAAAEVIGDVTAFIAEAAADAGIAAEEAAELAEVIEADAQIEIEEQAVGTDRNILNPEKYLGKGRAAIADQGGAEYQDAADNWAESFQEKYDLEPAEDGEAEPGEGDSGPQNNNNDENPEKKVAEDNVNADDDQPTRFQKFRNIVKRFYFPKFLDGAPFPLRAAWFILASAITLVIFAPILIPILWVVGKLAAGLCALSNQIQGKDKTCPSCETKSWKCAYECCQSGCNMVQKFRKWLTEHQGEAYIIVSIIAVLLGIANNNPLHTLIVWVVGWILVWLMCGELGYVLSYLICDLSDIGEFLGSL